MASVSRSTVFGFVSQPRAAVLEARDPGVGIARAHPLGVADPLALTGPVELLELGCGRGRYAARLGHPGKHRAVALTAVAPLDRAHRRVRFHGRGIDADPLTLDQVALSQAPQHPGEHGVMNLQWQPAAGLGQPGMIRHCLPHPKPQEFPQRQAVGAAPLEPALAVDALEVPRCMRKYRPGGSDRAPITGA